jgi:hypothetical protein
MFLLSLSQSRNKSQHCLWLRFLLSLSQSHNKTQHTDPINYTAYRCSQMQDFSVFWSQLVLYIALFYWHPQILLDNKLKWFKYSVIHFMYVSYGYQNIQLYTYMYGCILL